MAVKALVDNGVLRLRNKGADGNFLTKIKDESTDGSTSLFLDSSQGLIGVITALKGHYSTASFFQTLKFT